MAATTSNPTPRKNGFDFAALTASAGKQNSADEVARLRAALETLAELVIAHGVMDARTLESIVGDLIAPPNVARSLSAPLPPPAPSAAEALLRGPLPKPAPVSTRPVARPVAAKPAPAPVAKPAPVVQQPIAQQPIAQQPTVQMAAPVVQKPVAQPAPIPQPAPVAQPPVAQPAPVVQAAPVVQQPVGEKTLDEQLPIVHAPVVHTPHVHAPVVQPAPSPEPSPIVPPSPVQPVVASPFPAAPTPAPRRNPFDAKDAARLEAELTETPALQKPSFLSRLFRPKTSPAAVAAKAASIEFTERVPKLPVDGLYAEQQRATELSFPPPSSVQRKPRAAAAAAPRKKAERPANAGPTRFCDRCWRRMDASGTCQTCSPSASA